MDFSFILVEYHNIDETKRCINSIFQKVIDVSFEVIVSSNSHYDRVSQIKISKMFPANVHWIFNGKNLGFARAVNRGIKRSKGKYIFLLSSDAQILSVGLKDIFQLFDKDTSIGVLGPSVLDDTGAQQDTARKFMSISNLGKRLIARILLGKKVVPEYSFSSEEGGEVDWVSGASMIIRREVIREVGLFDERYFMYVEDMDFCKRIRDWGYKVYFWPKLKIQYQGSRRSVPLNYLDLITVIFNKYSWIHFVNYLRFLRRFHWTKDKFDLERKNIRRA